MAIAVSPRIYSASDEIFYKLTSGALPVGLANKLSIEIDRKLQVDLSSAYYDNVGRVDGIRIAEAKRERATDALLEQSDQIAASQPQPRSPATNCAWSGNTLNCTTLR
jgi:hypothetical protein